jgi:hypothetical protein
MIRWWILAAVGLCLPAVFAASRTEPANARADTEDVTSVLRAKDQALLDAIAPGDQKVWDAAMASDAVYVDENGESISRADFMKQLTPLPADASGTLKIRSYSATIHGDVATVIHADDEEENYHGQLLKAGYLITETWQNVHREWKLLLVHTYAILHEPPTQKVAAREIASYAGRYTAADLVYVIRVDGDHLVGGRQGKPEATLNQEVRDVFFVGGQLRTRKIFQRDVTGKVTGFVDRREGIDLVWTKR